MREKNVRATTVFWTDLNKRQQHYLKVLFDLDQAKEEQRRESWRYDRVYQAIPAAEWRAIPPIEFSLALGKLPRGERWEAIVEELQALALIEVTREGERLTSIQMSRTGRRVVRAGLDIPTQVRQVLTESQERYARSIANAGLASLEEVRAAFLDKRTGDAKIQTWGAQLARIERAARKEAERQYVEEHTRYEPCAYPGCTQQVRVAPIAGASLRMYPDPALSVLVWRSASGWHYEKEPETGKRVRKANNDEQKFAFYGCSPAHCEAIARMRLQVTLLVDPEAERELAQVRYPVSINQNARLDVADLARRTAVELVAQTPHDADLPTDKTAIGVEARRQITLLNEEATKEGKELADDLDLFRRLYRLSFRDGWLSAVQQRQQQKEPPDGK